MFCRMFEFKEETQIDIIPFQICDKQCEYYTDGKSCKLCRDVSISLYKNEKYNWNIVRIINFTGDELLENEETLVSAIKLIHPTHPNVWILRWQTLENKEVVDSYSVYISAQEIKVEDLEKLNWYLRKTYKYDGRAITEKDFQVTKEPTKN